MNGDQHMEMHYVNTGFPYCVAGNSAYYFDGSQAPSQYPNPEQFHNEETTYWSMNMNWYKFGFSGMENSYYTPYECSSHLSTMDLTEQQPWNYPVMMNVEEPVAVETVETVESTSVENTAPSVDASPEDSNPEVPEQQDGANDQVILEDDIDPDNMTYEELLDLGEAVGTQSRGLSKELIDLLPTSKYKFSWIFSKKRYGERCVICQMKYKRGDRQMNLPCKHVYHSDCVSKWLGINKTCPICNAEVSIDEPSH
nr:E3 ubiquitin ligase BIG BROTHER [Ipomoea batatas]